jgi:hypothetical protein
VRRTEGDVTSLTKAEARVIPVIYRAMQPRWTKLRSDAARAWQCYVWARFYLSWVSSDRDEQDFALLMAALQSDGKWPVTAWARIERPLKAVAGWLPPELIEVN